MSRIVSRPRWRPILVSLGITGIGLAVVGAGPIVPGRDLVTAFVGGLAALAGLVRAACFLRRPACETCMSPIDIVRLDRTAPVSATAALVRALRERDGRRVGRLMEVPARTNADRAALLVVEHCFGGHVGRARVHVRRRGRRSVPARGARWVELPGRQALALSSNRP